MPVLLHSTEDESTPVSVTTLRRRDKIRVVGRPKDSGIEDAEFASIVRVLNVLVRRFDGVTDMAKKCDVNQPHLSQVLKGNLQRKPGLVMLSRIAKKTGVAIDTMMGHQLAGSHLVEQDHVQRALREPDEGLRRDIEEALARIAPDKPAPPAGKAPAPKPPRSRATA